MLSDEISHRTAVGRSASSRVLLHQFWESLTRAATVAARSRRSGFRSRPTTKRSSSTDLVAAGASLQKRGGVVQVVVGARIHAVARAPPPFCSSSIKALVHTLSISMRPRSKRTPRACQPAPVTLVCGVRERCLWIEATSAVRDGRLPPQGHRDFGPPTGSRDARPGVQLRHAAAARIAAGGLTPRHTRPGPQRSRWPSRD